ncbi:MAG: hypothetical protein V4722_16100 [Bacteroidota bacterium]
MSVEKVAGLFTPVRTNPKPGSHDVAFLQNVDVMLQTGSAYGTYLRSLFIYCNSSYWKEKDFSAG